MHDRMLPPQLEFALELRVSVGPTLEVGAGSFGLRRTVPITGGIFDVHKSLSVWAETPEPARSDCHAWSASPNYDLLTIVAGIHPGAPGFKNIRIEPHLEGLHQLKVTMPHPNGMIETSYRLDGNRWIATVTLPPGVDGDFGWKAKVWPLHSGVHTLTLSSD